MTIITRHRVLFLFLFLLSLGLVACSDDTVTSPTGTDPQPSLDDVWQTEIDAIAAMDGGAELLEELAPELEQARASLDDTALKSGGSLFIALQRTQVEVVPPYPPPYVHLLIYYQGVGTVLGRHTGFSDSYVDITVVPAVQTGITTYTDAHGDDLVIDSLGYSDVGPQEGTTAIWGDGTVTGGTGRFEDASGNASYIGLVDDAAAAARVVWVGWIHLDD